MRCSRDLSVMVMIIAVSFVCTAALAQMPNYPNIGRAPTQDEVRAWDIAIGLDGKELPPGSGTAKEGAEVYAKKCMSCHGEKLEGALYLGIQVPALTGGKGTLKDPHPVKTVASYWPFATTVWDFINRAMPRYQERTLKPDEVYAVTAFIFYKNDIIQETDVMDAKSLPKVKMPNHDNFLPKRFEDINNWEKRGCRLGHCPDN
jgi:cytochrome c